MSDADLRITTHDGEVLDTHEARVAAMCNEMEAVKDRMRTRPTVEQCVLFVAAVYDVDPNAFGWYPKNKADGLLSWWFGNKGAFGGKAPAEFLHSRRSRRRIIAWAEEVVARKRERDERDTKEARIRRFQEDLKNRETA